MLQTEPIRVVIADDHDVLRSGLAMFLDTYDDLQLVGQASTGAQAVDLCLELQPDVVLMDLRMPDLDGVTATYILRQKCPGIRVVALTSYQDEELVQAAVQAGATSYVLKNVSTEELAQIIRDAYHGKSTLSPEATQALIRLAKRTPHSNYGLTEREHEVLALMIKGMSNGEIADRLTISRFTVKKHVSNILAKLSVSSRTEAVAMAIQNKLVDVSG